MNVTGRTVKSKRIVFEKPKEVRGSRPARGGGGGLSYSISHANAYKSGIHTPTITYYSGLTRDVQKPRSRLAAARSWLAPSPWYRANKPFQHDEPPLSPSFPPCSLHRSSLTITAPFVCYRQHKKRKVRRLYFAPSRLYRKKSSKVSQN